MQADQEATVVATVAGEVREILVEEGDAVKAGQVLARLDGDRRSPGSASSASARRSILQPARGERRLRGRDPAPGRPAQARAARLSIDAVTRRVRAENVNLSGGRPEQGTQRFLVRTLCIYSCAMRTTPITSVAIPVSAVGTFMLAIVSADVVGADLGTGVIQLQGILNIAFAFVWRS